MPWGPPTAVVGRDAAEGLRDGRADSAPEDARASGPPDSGPRWSGGHVPSDRPRSESSAFHFSFGIPGTARARVRPLAAGSASSGSSYPRTQTRMGNTNQPGGTKGTKPLEKWEIVVAKAMQPLGAKVSLSELYATVEGHERTKVNPHWKAKIRQVLQRSPLFKRAERGVWMLKHPAFRGARGREAR